MGQKLANNAYGTLASSISTSDTTINLVAGHGARFPSLGAGDYFYATLADISNNLEIVKVTARAGDVFTVVRGRDGTTAKPYPAGSIIELRAVRATFQSAAQEASVAISLSGTDDYTGTLSPAPEQYETNQVYWFRFTNTNTISATTVNLNGFGQVPLRRHNGNQFSAGEIPTGFAIPFTYTGSQFRCLLTTFAYLTDGSRQITGSFNQEWLVTAGSGIAYTITPTDPLSAYEAGHSYLVRFHVACGTNPTLAISGLSSPPNLVKRNTDGTLSNLAANDIPTNWRSRVVLLSATQALVEDMPASGSGGGATNTVPRLLENVGLSVSMASNAVTIALKGADGNDPSASNKVGIGFRNATLANGNASKVEVTSPVSVTVSAGSTLGTVSGEASRVWVAAMLVSGAVELAVFQSRSGQRIAPINEGGLISTTAEGGAGGADNAQTWYSTTARTDVPFTVLGYFDSTQATAGNWTATPSAVVVNPTNRPGDILQVARSTTSSMVSTTAVIPYDNTPPQSNEGAEVSDLNTTITPSGAPNLIRITVDAIWQRNNQTFAWIGALFRDSETTTISAWYEHAHQAPVGEHTHKSAIVLSGGTSSQTFKLRFGPGQGGFTARINADADGNAIFGTGKESSLMVEEISV